MSKKTTSELRASKSRNEGRAEIGAIAVIAGLVCEVVLAAALRDPTKTFIEEWGPVLANFLIAAGVAAEVWFGRRALGDADALVEDANNTAAFALLTSNNSLADAGSANLKAAQAEVRAAEAREETERLRLRTAELEVELARLRAPRSMSPETFATFVATMKKHPYQPYGGIFGAADDAAALWAQIDRGLRDASWNFVGATFKPSGMKIRETAPGVMVWHSFSAQFGLKRAAEVLASALLAAGITSKASGSEDVSDNAILIEIGPKI